MHRSTQNINRRDALKCSLVGTAAALTATGSTNTLARAASKPDSAKFYRADGSFDPVAAKQAYYDMMNAFGYPIADSLKTDELWVADFVQREFAKLGMGGVFWLNASGKYGETGAKEYAGEFKGKNFGYLGHEIYLLPGQMLPEHRHIGGAEGYGPKMECWLVRYGTVDYFGEYYSGEEKRISEMPDSEKPWGYGQDWFKSKYVTSRTGKEGKVYVMADPESWHFQRAGAEGAIVTEFATYHNHVEFSKPGMEFASSEAK